MNKKIQSLAFSLIFSSTLLLSACQYYIPNTAVVNDSQAVTEVQAEVKEIDSSASIENVNEQNNSTTDQNSNEIALADNNTSDTETTKEDESLSNDSEKTATFSLYKKFEEHNMRVGTCLSPQMIANPRTNELLLNQFNSVTMENAMKPDYILSLSKSKEAQDIVVEFNDDAIKMLEYAKENNLSLRGHTLIWHSQTPDWIFYEDFDVKKEFVTRDVMIARMESYIKQVFTFLKDNGYSDMFYAYDVVNEAIMEDGSLRDSNWKTVIGDDYLWYAFNYADIYAPQNIDLYYNDYNEQYKAAAIVKMASSLVDEAGNSFIDGIGLQAHLYTQDNLTKYFSAIDKIAESGLKMQITELDVGLGAWQNTLKADEENLNRQGDFYYELINGIFERVDSGKIKMDSLTFWGFVDYLSWRKEASPLLFDINLDPKPAYFGALQDESHK